MSARMRKAGIGFGRATVGCAVLFGITAQVWDESGWHVFVRQSEAQNQQNASVTQESHKATGAQEAKQKEPAATAKADARSGKNSGTTEIEYMATVESLRKHPLPAWYADAKLGIFIHWGLYSVPGWAVPTPPNAGLSEEEYLKNNPYAEWYLNTLRLEGSPTQKYHKQNYGPNYDYYNFADTFNKEIQRWNPEAWPGCLS